VRTATVALIQKQEPGAQTSDTNYVFLSFVLAYLPAGLIGWCSPPSSPPP
jgi:hypothetical protein